MEVTLGILLLHKSQVTHVCFREPLYTMSSSHLLSYGDSLLELSDVQLLQENDWINDKLIDFCFE